MKSRRPYLIRALYDWIVESDATPFILVKVNSNAVVVPMDYVTDGQITLNIAPSAVRDLLIGDELMTFAGRFSGQSVQVTVPLDSIAAVYARETGDGMLFDTERTEAEVSGASSREHPSRDPFDIADDDDTHGVLLDSLPELPPEEGDTARKGDRSVPYLRVIK